MKRALVWIATLAAAGIGGYYTFLGVQSGRRRLKGALRQTEAVASSARATLEETERTLRATREAI